MITIDKNIASSRAQQSRKTLLWANIGMLATAAVWGLSFVSTKVLTEQKPVGLQPVEIYLYRFILAYVVMLALCHKRILAYSWRDELLFLLLGLTGGSLYFVTENIAVTRTDVANVSLITSLSPLITTFIIAALYRSERPGVWTVIGSLIALGGVFCVVLDGGEGASIHPVGDLLALCAAVSFSIYSIIIKKVNATYSALFITRKSFFYGLVTALPFMALEPQHAPISILLQPQVYGNLIFLGVMCSLGGFLMMAKAIDVIGPIKANNYLYVQPLVTLIAGWLILNQSVGWIGFLGCLLIIGGLWLSDRLK